MAVAKAQGLDRVALWLALLAPLAVQTYRVLDEHIYYGEYLHWTGLWATWLLIVTLAVSTLRRFGARLAVTRWLLRRRRDLGLITFAYATAHTLAYLFYKADAAVIAREAIDPGMLTGWIAGLIFVLLALTSNDLSVRRLGRRWNTLHRGVYLAAVLTLAHWLLTAFDPTTGWVHAGLVGVLLVLRVWPRTGSRQPSDTPSQ